MKLITVLLVLLIMMPAVPLLAIDDTTLIYREKTGGENTEGATAGQDHEEVAYVIMSRGDLIHIKADFKDEFHKITTDQNLDTRKLEILFQKNPSTITIQREADRFVIGGKQNRSIQVDPEIPWYQTLISLKEFTLSGDSKRSFYSLSSHFDERLSEGKGIQLLRLVAKKEAKESVEINGKKVEAWRVMVTFDDIRSLFWKSHYWYRRSDGLLVRYREVRGGPGTPETVGTLIK